MKKIIPPINKELLISELSNCEILRVSKKGNNHIYTVNNLNAPNVVREIGRLREISYRNIGSGTGKDCDIDLFDLAETPYNQLIVWDPQINEILGGYRYVLCNNLKSDKNEFEIGTSRLFGFSEKFKIDYLPKSIELGRSFVKPEYQISSNARKSLFVLDSLWEGLGALVVNNPKIEYFFGQVSIFENLNPKSIDLILYFLETYFPSNDNLVNPKKKLPVKISEDEISKIFTGENENENYAILSRVVRSYKENIPPLINTYINTTPNLKTFGAVQNPFFKNMIDIGILIAIKDIYETKKKRYIYSFNKK